MRFENSTGGGSWGGGIFLGGVGRKGEIEGAAKGMNEAWE